MPAEDAKDDTTSDYGAVLPLPVATHGPMNEAILSRLVVAQGLATREQLRGLLAGRAQGDLRPLEELLLASGLVQPADLERLRASSGAAEPSTKGSGVVKTRASGAGWGAATAAAVAAPGCGPEPAAARDVDATDAAEKTLMFDGVLSAAVVDPAGAPGSPPAVEEFDPTLTAAAPAAPAPAAGAPGTPFDPTLTMPAPAVPLPLPAAPPASFDPTLTMPAPAVLPLPGTGALAPAAGPAPADARPFSASAMEWDRARPGVEPSAGEDTGVLSGESARLDRLVRPPRPGPRWPYVAAVLVVLAALAGARLVTWSQARRRAEWLGRVDAALRRVALGDGEAVLAVLPEGPAPDALAGARRELARGAALVLRGDPGAGLAALGQGQPALAQLEPEVALALERVRARGLAAAGRKADAVAAIEAALAGGPDAALLELGGDLALELGRPEEAVRRYEAAAQATPDEVVRGRTLRRAVELLLDAGDAARALEVLERAPAGRAGGLAVLRGDASFVLGRLAQARAAYGDALSHPDGAGEARVGLARVALAERDLPAAREHLDAAAPGPARQRLRAALATASGRPLDALALLAGLGDDEAARLLAANAYVLQGDIAAALAALTGLEPADRPAARLAGALRARARLLEGDLDRAQAEVDLLGGSSGGPGRGPTRPRLLLLGPGPLSLDDVEALPAILLAELALAREPLQPERARVALAAAVGSARARLALGQLERRAGALDAARAALLEAAALAPRDPAPRLELARVELTRGELEEAREAFDAAVELDPAAPAVRLERAEVLLRLGRPDAAVEDLRRCHGAVDPLRLLVLQARVATARGAMSEAADRWVAALRLDPDDPRLLAEAARACGAADRVEEAERLLGRLADQHPNDPAVQLGRARLLLDRDQLQPALEAATRAAVLAPGPEAHLVRAHALLRLGKLDDARLALDEAGKKGESAEVLVARALLEVHAATQATAEARGAEARKLLDRTLALDVTVSVPGVLTREGRRHAAAGRPVQAELALRLALERDRAFRDAHHALVQLLSARGDWRAVRDAATKLLAEFPDDQVARQALDLAEKRLPR